MNYNYYSQLDLTTNKEMAKHFKPFRIRYNSTSIQPYHVIQVAKNGRIRNSTENLSSKAACYTNIKGSLKDLGSSIKFEDSYIDETLKAKER